jgi:hypothetical protein
MLVDRNQNVNIEYWQKKKLLSLLNTLHKKQDYQKRLQNLLQNYWNYSLTKLQLCALSIHMNLDLI